MTRCCRSYQSRKLRVRLLGRLLGDVEELLVQVRVSPDAVVARLVVDRPLKAAGVDGLLEVLQLGSVRQRQAEARRQQAGEGEQAENDPDRAVPLTTGSELSSHPHRQIGPIFTAHEADGEGVGVGL